MTSGKPLEGASDPAASMGLLTTILENALDPGYRRRAQEKKVTPFWYQIILGIFLAALVAGALFAGKTLRGAQIESRASRDMLISQIEEYIAQIEVLTTDIAGVDQQIKDLGEISTPSSDVSQPALVASAQSAVDGPGTEVILTESEALSAQDRGFVTDAELRTVVNILWSAGAEAVAVNNVRLGPESTIRTAGSAILVDFTAVASPYVVQAIGNPKVLNQAVSSGTTGSALKQMSKDAGYTMSVRDVSDITLTASTARENKYVQPEEGDQ